MTSNSNLPGLYGKIPTLGDFVSRRLSTGFIETWDKWLQQGLSASKEQLGPQWTEIYLSSPIWHFLVSPGICGKAAWAGVLMPSVDKVGRYFPLTLAAAIDGGQKLADIVTGAGDWFKKMERLALSVLENNVEITELDDNLKALGLPNPTGLHVVVENAIDDTHHHGRPLFSMSLDEFDRMTEALAHIGYQRLTGARSVFTLWRTTGSATMEPSLRIYENLPPMDVFSTFLHGKTKPVRVEKVQTPPAEPAVELHKKAASPSMDTTQKAKMFPNWSSVAVSQNNSGEACLNRPEIGLWAVADGVALPAGGMSEPMVIDALGPLVATGNLKSYVAYATECLRGVNSDLFDMAVRGGTSIVVMLAVGTHCAVIWGGNSRLYSFRNNKLTLFTPESSDQNKYVAKALGIQASLSCMRATFEAKAGDLYLLLSDSLTRTVNHQDIETIMKQENNQACAEKLIDLSAERGEKGKVTAVVSRFQ